MLKLNDYYKSFSGANLFLKNTWKTCDHIWRLAGDKSLDFNYYSKRILLYTIYTKAYKAYFCGNNSDRVQKTSDSIDKGLDRVKNINKDIPPYTTLFPDIPKELFEYFSSSTTPSIPSLIKIQELYIQIYIYGMHC